MNALRTAIRENNPETAFNAALRAAREQYPHYSGAMLLDTAERLINQQQRSMNYQTDLYYAACEELGIPAY
jgi:hypothetical protein